jgi:hypothetical protein
VTRLAKLIAVTTSTVALLAPVAWAGGPDDQAGPRGPGAIAALYGPPETRPDDRAGVRGPGAVAATAVDSAAPVRPDDRAGSRGPGAVVPTVVATPERVGGFDWRDAMIGGVAGLGTALLVGGCAVLVLSQRGRTRTV